MNLLKSAKFRNVLKNNKFAIVVGNLKSIDSWDAWGVRIYSNADIVTHQGDYLENTDQSNPQYISVKPNKKWSFVAEEPVLVQGKFNVKKKQRNNSY
jgi:pyridoxamine 5'-phosphate oxidase family protein